MNRRFGVILTGLLAIGAFAVGTAISGRIYAEEPAAKVATVRADVFVRSHSPIIGPKAAPVTIVEFFDPSCEACRAFHPGVKQILAAYPKDVRLVLRYLPLHQGSAEAIGILEADIADANKLGVKGTPSFFVNGKPLAEFSPEQLYAQVRAQVEDQRRATQK